MPEMSRAHEVSHAHEILGGMVAMPSGLRPYTTPVVMQPPGMNACSNAATSMKVSPEVLDSTHFVCCVSVPSPV